MPRRILLIIPISTTHMTSDLRAAYPSTAETEFLFLDGSGIEDCPPCISNDDDGRQSTLAILPRVQQYIQSQSKPIDGILVCCFSDHPLVYALYEQGVVDKAVHVTGIMHAAMQCAKSTTGKFGIVTTNNEWEDILDSAVKRLSYDDSCVGVKATGLGVLELESKEEGAVVGRIVECAREMIDAGAGSVVLGCCGMARLEGAIRTGLGVEVVDGVKAGVEILTKG